MRRIDSGRRRRNCGAQSDPESPVAMFATRRRSANLRRSLIGV
jgi:hypothetical protein